MERNNTKKVFTMIGWFLFTFLLGGVFGFATGYGAHYYKINKPAFEAICEDGAKPDKHGCCAGEFYMDAGDGWMVCCPNGGDHCYPPMFQPIR